MSGPPPQVPPPEPRRISGTAIASLAALAVVVVFVVQNTERVDFEFLWLSFTWPLWLYTVVVAACGALTWIGIGAYRRHRRRTERRSSG
jgi:uncharacterized integral membrane protein